MKTAFFFFFFNSNKSSCLAEEAKKKLLQGFKWSEKIKDKAEHNEIIIQNTIKCSFIHFRRKVCLICFPACLVRFITLQSFPK